MTDKEWAIAIVRAWEATDSMDTSIDMVRTFRAEVLREAAERAVEWLRIHKGWMGWRDNDTEVSSFRAAILGDQVSSVSQEKILLPCPSGHTEIYSGFAGDETMDWTICCQHMNCSWQVFGTQEQCETSWQNRLSARCLDPAVQDAVQKNFWKLIDPPPPDILMDARQDKLHVDMQGRRAVKAVFRPDAEKIGPAIQALLEENHHGIDCPTCAESVDGAPGAACCGQCRKEDER